MAVDGRHHPALGVCGEDCSSAPAEIGIGLNPAARIADEITEAKKVAWCGCKHSNNKPFCDGSHAKLPA